ncbi:CNP1-like family protein [Ramlibacter sp. 2FC]|uniref:CNP1-like family protein n=1 Tax=Ramlibacter sp. 2FC TaxID=2502188 RepID=UPI0010F53C60|nr:CNP1-like family protein [Ramlibacter sp. 2FC]
MRRRARRAALALALSVLAATGAWAQLVPDAPDWRESEVPPPPAFDVKRLLTVEMPRPSSLSVGVDPATLSISRDGIVRYVVVAASPSGAMNVMYEGIRCSTAQHRVYARHHPDSGWTTDSQSAWRSLRDPMPSRYPLVLARTALCSGAAPNGPVAEIVRSLKNPYPSGQRD